MNNLFRYLYKLYSFADKCRQFVEFQRVASSAIGNKKLLGDRLQKKCTRNNRCRTLLQSRFNTEIMRNQFLLISCSRYLLYFKATWSSIIVHVLTFLPFYPGGAVCRYLQSLRVATDIYMHKSQLTTEIIVPNYLCGGISRDKNCMASLVAGNSLHQEE